MEVGLRHGATNPELCNVRTDEKQKMTSLQTFIDAYHRLDITSVDSILSIYKEVAGGFVWDFDKTPLASFEAIGITLVAYLVISYTFSFLLGTKTLEEFKEEQRNPTFFQTVLKWVAFAHNLNMTVISVVCFVGLVYEVTMIGMKDGFYALLCDPEHLYNTGYIPFWTYLVGFCFSHNSNSCSFKYLNIFDDNSTTCPSSSNSSIPSSWLSEDPDSDSSTPITTSQQCQSVTMVWLVVVPDNGFQSLSTPSFTLSCTITT